MVGNELISGDQFYGLLGECDGQSLGGPTVSTYRATRELPESLQAEVPSIEDLQDVVEKLRPEMISTTSLIGGF